MLSIFRNGLVCRFWTTNFKVNEFESQDYKAMCLLLRQKYPIYNNEMRIYSDIRLLDQDNKFIGIYSSPQARRKAQSTKKDIVLVNSNVQPAICKLVDFRNALLNKFFDEIITNRNKELLSRASSIKTIKIKLTYNQLQLTVKAKQINQLAKKHSKMRIYLTCKKTSIDEAYSKMEYLKSLIQNNCQILQDARQWQNSEEKSQNDSGQQFASIAMVIKSRENQFVELLEESAKQSPDKAIKNFLKRYYKQVDVDMRDLKAKSGTYQQGSFQDLMKIGDYSQQPIKQQKVENPKEKPKKGRLNNLKRPKFETAIEDTSSYKAKLQLEEIAKNAIFTDRLKGLLTAYRVQQ